MMIRGCEFELDPNRNATEFKMYRKGRTSEQRSISTLQKLVSRKNCLLLDVGANVGIYSVFLGSQMAAGSKIIAFEPNPEVAERLARNLEINNLSSLAQIEPVALGASDSVGTLSVSQRNQGASSLVINQGAQAQALEIPVRKLSTYLPQADEHDLWILKADIEGYEDRALASLLEPSLARRPDHILMEITHSDHWQSDLLGDLAKLGYRRVEEMDGNVLLKLD